MSNILVTGGLGFIGSNFISKTLKGNHFVVNIDSMTYASTDSSYLQFESHSNYKYYNIDINNFDEVNKIINNYTFDKIFHFAAESHVDNSISDPFLFAKTNVIGTLNLLESYKNLNKENKLFIHVSTDEVFGSIEEEKFNELSSYSPNSPYSASKASSDHFVRSYFITYKLPVIITNCSNNYGRFQNKEKFIPTVIKSLIERKKIPIYGKGNNIREWIYVEDHVNALLHLSKNGQIGESYCVGSDNEFSNIDLVKKICKIFDELTESQDSQDLISFVKDRKGHDFRYAVNSNKIQMTGWTCEFDFEESLKKTVEWYLNNKNFLI